MAELQWGVDVLLISMSVLFVLFVTLGGYQSWSEVFAKLDLRGMTSPDPTGYGLRS